MYFSTIMHTANYKGRPDALGAGGPRFESWYPDRLKIKELDQYLAPFFLARVQHGYNKIGL